MGDFAFDPRNWSDVPGMVAELKSMGMETMVSVWPFLAENSSGIATVLQHGWALTEQNTSRPVWWDDNNCAQAAVSQWDHSTPAQCVCYDPSQEAARRYIWSRIKDGYYGHGIRTFWLDGAEPEISTAAAQFAADHYNSSIGTGQATGMLFPDLHTQMIAEGLRAAGETEHVMLTRSAWAGMSRNGAALWSGDTKSDWRSLQVSVQAGLSVQLSGIALWSAHPAELSHHLASTILHLAAGGAAAEPSR